VASGGLACGAFHHYRGDVFRARQLAGHEDRLDRRPAQFCAADGILRGLLDRGLAPQRPLPAGLHPGDVEAAAPSTPAEIRRLALAGPAVKAINELRTVHFCPNQILANISLDFKDSSDLVEVEQTVVRLEQAFRESVPNIAHVFVEAQARESRTGPRFGVPGSEAT
jgi:hypothetical protein